MSAFDKALAFVLAQEGGYSNDPHDSGGETRFGISAKAYPNEDIRGMTRDRAAVLYRRDYWDKCKCDALPDALAIAVFDSAVNQGPSKAVRLLQSAVRAKEDGIIGPQTLISIHSLGIDNTLSAFIGKRGFQYAIHPEVLRFGGGWFRRLAECHQLAMESL